jgi:hypothetical protein
MRLTAKQAEALRERVLPPIDFLFRCRRRMAVLRFDEQGAIYQAIAKACCAMNELHAALLWQYLGHEPGRADESSSEVTSPTGQAQSPPSHPGT